MVVGGHGRDGRRRSGAHCDRTNHTSNKCWGKFDKPEQAQVTDFMFTSASTITSSIVASTMQIYEHFFQLQTAQAS